VVRHGPPLLATRPDPAARGRAHGPLLDFVASAPRPTPFRPLQPQRRNRRYRDSAGSTTQAFLETTPDQAWRLQIAQNPSHRRGESGPRNRAPNRQPDRADVVPVRADHLGRQRAVELLSAMAPGRGFLTGHAIVASTFSVCKATRGRRLRTRVQTRLGFGSQTGPRLPSSAGSPSWVPFKRSKSQLDTRA
jgi:hypothetical protein